MSRKKLVRSLFIIFLVNIIVISVFNIIPNADAASYRRGSTGSTVSTIQEKLKNWGYYSGEVDGIYGSRTEAAVTSFQRKNGLTADGIAGPKTLEAMGISSPPSSSPWAW